jgi:hypothetical protein
MEQPPKVNDVIKGDERFVCGFKFPSGYPEEPVQIGESVHGDNAHDPSRNGALFRVLMTRPAADAPAHLKPPVWQVFAVRLGGNGVDDPAGEHILIRISGKDELEIAGCMRLVFEPKSEWPEPEPKKTPTFLHRCC